MSMVHGTYTAYARWGCRCDRCRQYQNERVARGRADRLTAGRIQHGRTGWDDGCRCDICRDAHQIALHRYYYGEDAS